MQGDGHVIKSVTEEFFPLTVHLIPLLASSTWIWGVLIYLDLNSLSLNKC